MTDGKVSTDCTGCRLVNGFGLIAIGLYIFSQARHRKSVEKTLLKVISFGTVTFGALRLFNMTPAIFSNGDV